MKLAGLWAWWNQYGSVPLDQCLERAQQLGSQGGVIVKAGYWAQLEAFKAAGVRVAVECYSYPNKAGVEAPVLAAGIARGAEFAVIDAEAEWETGTSVAMHDLLEAFWARCPGVEVYGCVDTRGGRMTLPYQQVLLQRTAGIVPMIYPKAFQQSVAFSVAQAFSASLDGKDFWGKPVLPAIQTYDGIGAAAVSDQLQQVKGRGLPGCQAYTIAHATDEEWAAFVAAIPEPAPPPEEEDDMWLDEKVIGVDGQPVKFTVLAGGPPDYPTQVRELTRREHLLVQELGLLVDSADAFQNAALVNHEGRLKALGG